MKRINLLNKISRFILIQKKAIYQLAKSYADQKSILFIIGCQRSGTTLMLRTIEKDLNTKTYGEFSKLSNKDEHKGIRLNPLDLVEKEIQKDRAPFIILKPLVESQNILQLLKYFKGSKALWMYRNYRDVALSNLTRFGIKNSINNLRPIIRNDHNNWRSENVPEHIRKIIFRHFSENMNPYDAAVAFWIVRNNFFFELGLDKNPNVLLCRYENLIMSPIEVVESIYKSLGQNYPGEKITANIHSKSLGKGKHIDLSPEIVHLAKRLLDKLDKTYHMKNS